MVNNTVKLASYVAQILTANQALQLDITKRKIYRGYVSGDSVSVNGITYSADFGCIDDVFMDGDYVSCMLSDSMRKMVVIGR